MGCIDRYLVARENVDVSHPIDGDPKRLTPEEVVPYPVEWNRWLVSLRRPVMGPLLLLSLSPMGVASLCADESG